MLIQQNVAAKQIAFTTEEQAQPAEQLKQTIAFFSIDWRSSAPMLGQIHAPAEDE